MSRDTPSRRTRHPDLYTGPTPADRVPSWRATAALADALSGARRRFPAALARNGPGQLRTLVEALGS
jgi:hypothetical protein